MELIIVVLSSLSFSVLPAFSVTSQLRSGVGLVSSLSVHCLLKYILEDGIVVLHWQSMRVETRNSRQMEGWNGMT
jgi:hypothetical protein